MKIIKNIDFVGQTFIIGGYAIATTWTWIENPADNSFGMSTAFMLLCLGWWQMISATLMLIFGATNTKLRLLHFFTAIGYMILISIGLRYLDLESTHTVLNDYLIQLFWMVIIYGTPFILALLYYYLTWRLMFPIKPSGKFLPHISF